MFGEDSSVKISSFVSQLNAMIPEDKSANSSSSMGMFKKLLSQITACLSKPQTSSGTTSGASATSSITQLFDLASAHSKPDKSEQLGDDCGVLVTGCQSFETSADACPGGAWWPRPICDARSAVTFGYCRTAGDKSKAYGALTHSIEGVVKSQHGSGNLSNYQLVKSVRETLAKEGFSQNPCLECSDANAQAPFIC